MRHPWPGILVQPRGRYPLLVRDELRLLQDNTVRNQCVDVDRPACVIHGDGDGGPTYDVNAPGYPAPLESRMQELEQAFYLASLEPDWAHAVARSRSAA